MKKYFLIYLYIAFPVLLAAQNTNPVGAISGTFDVSPSGAATYTIPIECPPGINGIQPNISLTYNSQSGNGIAGIGWNIGGLSMISRVNKNIYHDNNAIAPFDWTKDSPFVLDGNRLVLANTYGTDSIVYYLEVDNFSKIVGCNITAYGPTYFKVYHKNGQVWQYGSDSADKFGNYHLTTDGSKRLGWMLTSIVDTNGNEIQFHYTGEISGTNVINHRISSISYARNRNVAGMSNSQIINCQYETRDDIIQTYVDGVLSKQDKRLKSIVVSGYTLPQECIYRRYVLDYALSAATAGKSNLVKITESAGCYPNETALNSTDVSWTNYSTDNLIQTTAVNVLENESIQTYDVQTWTAIDIDGDGISEVVSTYSAYNGPSETWPAVYGVYKAQNQNGNISFVKMASSFGKYTENLLRNRLQINNGGSLNKLVLGSPATAYFKGNDAPLVYVPVMTRHSGNFDSGEKYIPAFNIVDITTGDIKLRVPLTLTSKYDYDPANPVPLVYACGDVNNDGFDDFIIIDKKNHIDYGSIPVPPDVANQGYKVYISLGTPLPIPTISSCPSCLLGEAEWYVDPAIIPSTININKMYEWHLEGKPQQIFIADFNKDGLKDICVQTDSGYEIWGNDGNTDNYGTGQTPIPVFSKKMSSTDFRRPNYNLHLGDFNGDGLPDLIANSSGQWSIAINSGDYSTFQTYTQNNITVRLGTTAMGGQVIVTDFNEDGKSDLAIVGYSPRTVYWYASNGTNFSLQKAVPLNSYNYTVQNMIGDFNGDGKPDILNYGNNLYTGEKATGTHYLHTGSSPVSAGTVASITDGLNNVHKIDYKLLTDNSAYISKATDNYSPVHREMKGSPLCVIKRHTLLSGAEKRKVSLYNYSDAIIHLQGKGFLGFTQTTETDSIAGIITETYKKFDDCWYVMYPERTITKTMSNALIRTNQGGYRFEWFNIANNSVALIPVAEMQTDHLKGTTVTTTYSNHDTSGNPLIIKTDYGNGIYNTQSLTYGKYGSLFFNKITSKFVTYTAPNATPEFRSESFNYDTRGNIIQRISNSQIRTSWYNYDVYGNARSIDSYALTNGITRTQTMTYSPSGRFLASKTNHLNETVTYNYDEGSGLLRSQTDRIGTTSYLYDNFGRLMQTTFPDGIISANTLQWASSNAVGAKYYSYTTTSGQAPLTLWYDGLGREVRRETTGLNNRKIWVDTQYNALGQLQSVSEPYFSNGQKTDSTVYAYSDPFKRLSSVTNPKGTTTYSYNGLTTAINAPDSKRETTINSAGWVTAEKTNGKAVNFTHYADGKVKTATPEGGQPLALEYDILGNRTKLTDPDAGIIESKYNGFSELMWTKQKVHNSTDWITTTNNYAQNGLLQNITRNGEVTTYTYDGNNRVSQINISGPNRVPHGQAFTYDNFDRILTLSEIMEGRVWVSKTEYDAFGRVSKETFPSGYYTVNQYDGNGLLVKTTDSNGKFSWQAVDENARRQLTQEVQGGILSTHSFNNKGQLTGSGNSLSQWSYEYFNNGNLSKRSDNRTGQSEVFSYDTQNRLTGWIIYRGNTYVRSSNMSYSPATGNITMKSDLDYLTMNYGENGKPHALTSINGVPEIFPMDNLHVTYTDFKKIKTLTEGSKSCTLTYGVDEQRRKSEYYDSATGEEEARYYFGNYEEKVNYNTGITEKIHYISGAIYIMRSNGMSNLYYTFADNIGSLTALVNEQGQVERYAYDPWGLRRNSEDWAQPDSRTSWTVNRGYTGHEMLDKFKIINMNGRVYDPLTTMFFSPDPYVQAPDNWLNYNRYSYCLGNPFKYTDPTGEMADDSGRIWGYRPNIPGGNGGSGWNIHMQTYGSYTFSANSYMNNPGFSSNSHLNSYNYHNALNDVNMMGTNNNSASLFGSDVTRIGNLRIDDLSTIFCEAEFIDEVVLGTVPIHSLFAPATIGRKTNSATSSGSFWAGSEYAVPVWGTTKMASNFLSQRDYGNFALFYGMAFAEMFTLGGASMWTQSAKMGAVASGRMLGGNAVVIGEGMGAVRATAKTLQSQGINAKWYQAWGKNFPTNRLMTPSEFGAAQARNQRWINSKINQGYRIYDIGIDATRATRSPFYQLERNTLQQRNYPTTLIPR